MAWLTNWNYRKQVTIDETKVDADLTDFPVSVKLTSSNFDFSKALSTGYDIRFTSSDGTTLLKYERERHDATNQVAEYWVKIPSVSGTANTNFYIYYGNSGAADGADPTNVWETAAKGVWHSKDDPDTSHIKDSTANAYNGTKKAANEPIEADGKIAKAQNYDGVDDYVSVGNLGSFYSNGTIEFWMNPAVVENYRNPFTTKYLGNESGIRFEEASNGSFVTVIGNDAGNLYTVHHYIASGLSTNTWYHVVLVWNTGSNIATGYLNGVQKFNEAHTYWATTLPAVAIGNGCNNTRYWKGLIDEVRIYNTAESAAWIKASYNSGNDTLVSWGSEETAYIPRHSGTVGVLIF